MNFGRALLGLGDGFLDRVLCVIGTIVFSQIPEFMQQYLQRLGGHLDEARRQLAQFTQVATQSGLTLDRLITQTSVNGDPAVARLSSVMTESVERVTTLESAQSALLHASVWSRPFVFLQHLDHSIARATWTVFKPAIPTTVEGLIYAGCGMLVLLGLYHVGLKYPVTVASRSRRRRRALAAGV